MLSPFKRDPLRLRIVEKFGTQENFSILSGIHESIISKIVRGVWSPTPEQKGIFLKLLGKDIEVLFK